MTTLFFCQTVNRCMDQSRFLESISKVANRPFSTKAHVNEPDCKITIDKGEADHHSELVYASLAESEKNTLFQPDIKITFSTEDGCRFTDISKKLKSGVLKPLEIGQTIELLTFDGVFVINWFLEVDAPSCESIFDSPLNLVEQELSVTGLSVLDQLKKIISQGRSIEDKRNDEINIGKPLWTSRTLILDDDLQSKNNIQDWAKNWIGDVGADQQVHDANGTITAGWGNNLIQSAQSTPRVGDFQEVFASMQFVYAKLHWTNQIVTEILGKLRTKKIENKDQIELRKTEGDFFYVEYTLLEAEYSLQGSRRKLLLAIAAAWKVRDLIKNINYKILRIKHLLSEAISEKHGFMQKNIRGLLLIIGMFEALGAVVEIIHLAHSPEVESSHVPGFLSLIHSVNPDVIITMLLAFLSVLGLLAILFGISKGSED